MSIDKEREDAYNRIDQFLRNSLNDEAYADFSADLEAVYVFSSAAATEPLLEQITNLKEQVRTLEQSVRYESDLCQQALDSRKEMENEVVRYAGRVKRDRDYIFELRGTVEELQEEMACVRQALPEQWRDSVPSVAVSTLVAELGWARKQAYQDGLRDAAEKIEQQHHWITAPGGAALIYAMLSASQKEQK